MLKRTLKSLVAPSALKIAILITFFMLLLFAWSSLREGRKSYLTFLDQKWVDYIQSSRGEVERSDEIVIAVADAKSFDHFGRWPWPRQYMAALIESLNEHYQVRTIGFDILFSEPDETSLAITRQLRQSFAESNLSQTEEGQTFLKYMETTEREGDGDAKLASALKRYKNVVLGYDFFEQRDVAHLTEKEVKAEHKRLRRNMIKIVKNAKNLRRTPMLEGYYPELTIDTIANKRVMMGYFKVSIDPEDGVVRRVHTVIRANKRFYPSLALRMLSHYLGEDIQLDGDEVGVSEIRLGEKRLSPFPDSSFLINYKGPSQTFPHYSVVDIIDRTLPVENLKDKMVLVGVTESGVLDLRVTPVQEAYPGVEVHANLLDNLLTESYFRTDPRNDIYTFLLILGFGVLLGLILPRMKIGWGILLVMALLAGYTLFHRYTVTEWLTWPSFVFVFLSIFLNAVGVFQFMFFISDKDKRFIKGAFQQYLSPAVIDQLMDDPSSLKLGGEERVMTALFSDVKGFSTISEKLTPSELVHLLNEYLTEMSDIIMKFGGTVDKFEGDAIIAFFGAPVRYGDHSTRAALVCLEMQNRLAELRQQWRSEGKMELFQRIGINTGSMVVGNMGSRNRFDYTIMGNSVNLAARLEGVNKVYGMELMMSEMTYKACQDAIEAREIDLIRVVGIRQPVRIYEILGRKGELDPHRKEAFAIFHQGLEAYRGQKWDDAERSFKEVQNRIPEDGPSATFLKRCLEYRQSPPPEDWDGVYVATSK